VTSLEEQSNWVGLQGRKRDGSTISITETPGGLLARTVIITDEELIYAQTAMPSDYIHWKIVQRYCIYETRFSAA